MENKEAKISLGTAICIFIIVVLLVVIVAMYCKLNDKLENSANANRVPELEQNKSINKEENALQENQTEKEEVPVEDLYAIDYNAIKDNDVNIALAKISNGTLYYLDVNSIETMNYMSPCKENYKKLDTEVKRIKTVTLGTDTSNNYLIIKNDGTVKSLNIKKDGVSYEEYKELANYKVDDILEFDGETFTLKMLDGSIKKPQHFSGGSEEEYQETKEYNEGLLKEINKEQ